MKRTSKVVSVLFAVVSVYVFLGADQPDKAVEKDLKAVLLGNFTLCQKGDIDGSMAYIHSESPVYASTKNIVQQISGKYTLTYELTEFRFIGVDGEYAVGRGTQVTKKVTGPEFRDNSLDSVYIFRKEDGAWKLWQQSILEITYL